MFDPKLTQLLLAKGKELFRAPRQLVAFTSSPDADSLLNDLDRTPHAFVIACVMDRQIRAELAWLIPHRIKEKLGAFDLPTLASLSLDKIQDLMSSPEPLHRFPSMMAGNLHAAIHLIQETYAGDASAIWANSPSSALVVFRFLGFQGVGPKIATMAANILARDLKVPMADYYSIDLSVDVQVRRVFSRLGLVKKDAPDEALIYAARAISPGFPGMLDFPCWDIGRKWCRPVAPRCQECYVHSVCPSSLAKN